MSSRAKCCRAHIIREPGMFFDDFMDGILAALCYFDPCPLRHTSKKATELIHEVIAGLNLRLQNSAFAEKSRDHALYDVMANGLQEALVYQTAGGDPRAFSKASTDYA